MKLLVLLALFSLSFAAEWQVLYPNVMTIAIGVSAPDASNVYVSGADDGSGSAILKSADEGNTWTSLPHDPQMLYLDIDLAPQTTFGVAPGVSFFGLTAAASVTTDGDIFEALPQSIFLSGAQSATSVDSKTFYLVGFWQERPISDAADGVYGSVDGGQTLRFFPWNAGTPARYGAFPSNNTWFISGGTWPAKDNKHQNTISQRIPKYGTFQLTPRVSITRQQDGTNSFQINTEPSVMGTEEGYIGVIGRTTDGGQTFQVVYNDTNRFYFNGIHCVNDKCWAVAEGPDGAWILHTPDNGNTWVEQLFLPDAGLFDVRMISETTGWAVGASISAITFNALFLYTADGGRTWTNTNTVDNAYPNAVTVVNAERAYATAFLRNGLSSILVYK